MYATSLVHLSWRLRCAVLVGVVYLYALSLHATLAAEPSTSTLKLRYADGLVDTHLEHVSLGEVLQALVRETGLQINSLDPQIASSPVSLAGTSIPLDKLLKTLLHGFSYALYTDAHTHRVIVVSTPPRIAATGIKMYRGEDPLAELSHDGGKQGTKAPQSLDEFQPIDDMAISLGGTGQEGDSSTQWARSRAHDEVLLERALAVIGSEHKNLYEEAIDELAALQDPRAIEALVQIVSLDTAPDSDTRSRAASALSQQAINSRFSDPVSVEALQRLVKDEDEAVSGIAATTLQEMQRSINDH